MKMKILGLLAVGLLVGPTAANAASLLRLDASSTNSELSDFFVLFADTGDGLLQFNEVTFFSGVTVTLPIFEPFANPIMYSVGDAPGFTTPSSLTSPCKALPGGVVPWCIGDAAQPWFLVDPSSYSYRISNQVPEPGTLALLGLGIVGMASTRRRKDGGAISA